MVLCARKSIFYIFFFLILVFYSSNHTSVWLTSKLRLSHGLVSTLSLEPTTLCLKLRLMFPRLFAPIWHRRWPPPEFRGECDKCHLLVMRFTGSALASTCVCHVWTSTLVCCVTADEKFLILHLQRSNNTTPGLSSALILSGGGGGEADVPARRQPAEVMCCLTTSKQTVWLKPGLFIYLVKIDVNDSSSSKLDRSKVSTRVLQLLPFLGCLKKIFCITNFERQSHSLTSPCFIFKLILRHNNLGQTHFF